MVSSPTRTNSVRYLQRARALLAAIAAVMVTFSPDHSAGTGLAIFSGFTTTTAIIMFIAWWMGKTDPNRWLWASLAAVSFLAGLATSIAVWRTPPLFFTVVTGWALISGGLEILGGLRARRGAGSMVARRDARDEIVAGVFGLLLAIGVLLIPAGYALNYQIPEAGQTYTLTAITIGVGLFGAYCAILAVFLGIAGFSPSEPVRVAESPTTVNPDPKEAES